MGMKNDIKKLKAGAGAIAAQTRGRSRVFKDKKRIAKNAWRKDE
jgi:hypothetical protein